MTRWDYIQISLDQFYWKATWELSKVLNYLDDGFKLYLLLFILFELNVYFWMFK